MYYVYILKLSNGNYYIGYSRDLRGRVAEHNKGRVRQTKHFLPVKLTFYAAFISKNKALDFEKYLKGGSGFAFRNRHFV